MGSQYSPLTPKLARLRRNEILNRKRKRCSGSDGSKNLFNNGECSTTSTLSQVNQGTSLTTPLSNISSVSTYINNNENQSCGAKENDKIQTKHSPYCYNGSTKKATGVNNGSLSTCTGCIECSTVRAICEDNEQMSLRTPLSNISNASTYKKYIANQICDGKENNQMSVAKETGQRKFTLSTPTYQSSSLGQGSTDARQHIKSGKHLIQNSSIIESVAVNYSAMFQKSEFFIGQTSTQQSNSVSCSQIDPMKDFEVVNGHDDNNFESNLDDSPSDEFNDNEVAENLFISDLNVEEDTLDLGDPVHECEFCRALMWLSERLAKSKRNSTPRFSLCCKEGKVQLPSLSPPPNILQQLHKMDDDKSRHFLKNIRAFNGMFSFTSMAGKVDHQINNGRAPPIFLLGGQNYHCIGSLLPTKSEKPKFAQLYIYDTDNEVDNRLTAVRKGGNISSIDREIVSALRIMLDEHNVLARSFRYARDRYKQGNFSEVKLKLIRKRYTNGRRYNLPTVSEVAALIVGDIDESMVERDVVIETQSKMLKRIDVLHPMYLALQYPLLFPYGEDGYRPDISICDSFGRALGNKRTKISMRDFFAYRIQDRVDESSVILISRRLFQQFLVDSYTMVESERLRYIRQNQPRLRVDQYKGLHECLVRGETDAAAIGQRIILPSSFTGGPRYMFNNCKDAFAICKFAGYPSYFITITCNPEWKEIKRFVTKKGLNAEDRPDILCRVFKMKLDELIRDLKEGHVFGRIKGYVCTIEFQKRGLPHAHILLFMDSQFKPHSPNDIDRYISAEIPDKQTRPRLYAVVERYMVHGPCGHHNQNSPCMVNGRCSKFFPKTFHPRTIIDEAGFPKYRRRDDGRTINKRNCVLDNTYIVPYNPALLLKYSCHINVEYTCQTSAIKYLFKYVHKGNDRVTASLFQGNKSSSSNVKVDEVRNYYDCRYISACEAAWRLFGFEIQMKEPAVIRMPFHLPNQQPVVFRDHENITDVLHRVDCKKTMLLGWMECNKLYHEARDLTYNELPSKFVWKDNCSKWMPRKQGFAIGRISHVPAGHFEDYYLRLLLNIQKGCISFEDVRTVGGVVHDSFKDACYALGLLQDDKEFIDAIIEASYWASGRQLRKLFVILLTSNNINRPEIVWEKCWQHLSDDVLYMQRQSLLRQDLMLSDEQIKNVALANIGELLQSNGKSLTEFPNMPFPSQEVLSTMQDMLLIEELNFDRHALSIELSRYMKTITTEQQNVFNEIINAVYNDRGGFFFLHGHGGTGKTFLWKTLSACIRSKGDIVLNVASSGIASLLLPNGRTAHSRFKIPLNINEDSTCSIKQGSIHAKLLNMAKLIIWDEAPMLSKYCYEAFDRCLKDVMRFSSDFDANLPFGGKVVVLGGDFRQILPVIPKGSRQDIVQASINSSYLWPSCKVLHLTKNMRLSIGANGRNSVQLLEFAQWLLKIGDGLAGDCTDGEAEVQIPGDILIHNNESGLDNLIDFVYPSILQNLYHVDYFKERSILAPTLEVVANVNNYIMSRLPGEENTYLSSDSLCIGEGNMESELEAFSPEILNAIECSGLPPHKLILKEGVPIMLLRNIDQSNGLCNGTRLQVKRMGKHIIECLTLTGNKVGQIVLIPRMNMIPNNDSIPIKFQRRQFPIIVSFAMTINKSQGQTLCTVGLYLPRPVFTHGQLYVALSRVKEKKGLRILLENHDTISEGCTINVVYREIFANVYSNG